MRKAIVALIGGLVLAVLLPLTASSAQASPIDNGGSVAAVKCEGKSCTGKNPQTTGCEKDAKTIATKSPGGGGPTVQLRYSKKCRSAWARLASKTPSWAFMLSVKDHPNYVELGSSEYKAYTQMAGKPLKYRACVKGWSSDKWYCTGWH
jgi:hypothetical protein